MGFFGSLGRIIAGKPVFTPEDEVAKQGMSPMQQAAQPIAPPDLQQEPTSKEIPELHCGRIECQINSGRCDLYVDILNHSHQQVFVNDVQLMGTHRQLQRMLAPGQAHQELLYSGPILMQHPDGYVTLRYRVQETNDYFRSQYKIRANQESDGHFRITELLPGAPIKDLV